LSTSPIRYVATRLGGAVTLLTFTMLVGLAAGALAGVRVLRRAQVRPLRIAFM